MLRRLNSLLGIVPVGAFFLVHMFFNSRAGQGPAQYQWVPDTLDQVPFLIVVELFGIMLPILLHAVLGVWISTRADYHLPSATRTWYGNIAFQLQRKLEWDPLKEQFLNDAEANRMLSRPGRGPWHL